MALSTKKKTLRMAQMAMLVALVVVLQLVSALLPPVGGVAITLTLVPVVIGAILFGVRGGAVLGFSFGLIVFINCIVGLDVGGNILWNTNPFLTMLICFAKGMAAGVVPALLYAPIKGKNAEANTKRDFVASLVAAISAPLVNTSLFVIGALLFFTDTLYAWQAANGATNMATYIIVGLAGINFLVELAINIVLTPAIVRIADILGNKRKL